MAATETPAETPDARPLAQIGAWLKEARMRQGLSQSDLATRSAVSSRTIGELERVTRDDMRFEPIAKLAAALEQDVRQWLDASGHEDVSLEVAMGVIERELGDKPAADEPRRVQPASPATISEWLQGQRRTDGHDRLVVVWRATPKPSERDDLVRELQPHVDGGLDVALAVPYPRPTDELGEKQPDLRARLLAAYANVEAFAQRLREGVSPSRREHVALYERTGGESAMPPPPLWLKTWPLVLVHHDGTEAKPLELAEWILTPTAVAPRLACPPPEGEADDDREAQTALWGDYLGPLLKAKVAKRPMGWRLRG